MNTELKWRMLVLNPEQAKELLARQDEIGVPHIYAGPGGTYAVRSEEWRAFQAILGGEHGKD
jgi:hypothetical protein